MRRIAQRVNHERCAAWRCILWQIAFSAGEARRF
jgi:hypothetical protein